ncbi:MAG: DUF4163 domain-containing protein [Clostridia bacterium]|nr:DUF4163 domain-containing protein [Clostridia bacterium]
MKRAIILICTILLTLIIPGFALADVNPGTDTAASHKVYLETGSKEYSTGGEKHTMSAIPFNYNGRIYVPVDFLAQALAVEGRDVNWHVDTDRIHLTVPALGNSYISLTMKPGSDQLTIDRAVGKNDKPDLPFVYDKTIQMDVEPYEKEGQIYLPLRWVAEACDFTVAWSMDSHGEKVLLTTAWEKSMDENNDEDNNEIKDEDKGEISKEIEINTEKIVSESEDIELDLEIPVISGLVDQNLQERINKEISDNAMEIKAELEKSRSSLVENIKDESLDTPLHTYQLFVGYETYNNGDILSLAVETYQYSGGAHGGTHVDFYNFDIRTGRLLMLSDLFQDDVDYISVINEEIEKQIADQRESGEDIYFDGDMGFQSIEANHPFYINDNQLILHFSQYEIAPYATGMPEFALPLTSLSKLLQDSIAELLT